MEPMQLELPDVSRLTDAYELAAAIRVSVQSIKLWGISGWIADPKFGRSKVPLENAALFIFENRRRYWNRFIQTFPECEGMFPETGEKLSIGQLVHDFDMIEVDTSNLDQVRQGLDIADKGLNVLTKEMRMQVIAGDLVKRADVVAQQRAFLTILEDNLGAAFIQRLATIVKASADSTEGQLFNLLSHQVNSAVNETVEELQRMFEVQEETFADIAQQAALDSS